MTAPVAGSSATRSSTTKRAPGIGSFIEVGSKPADGWRTNTAGESLVPTHCCFCGVQCGMYLRVNKDGHVFGVEPRDHPINKLKLCPKGVTAYQQVGHPDRLTYPLMRDHKGGELRRATWEEALTRVVDEITRIQTTYGRDAFGVYSGSSLTSEKSYLMGKFARVALGTKHIDYNGRLCMVSAAAANKKAFGIDRPCNPWQDLIETDVIMLAGTNLGECFPVVSQYVWGGRDRGAKLITIDPRQTPIARTADIHVPLRPGTDAAFFNGVLHVIEREGMIDEEFIAKSTTNWELVRDVVRTYDPKRVADICGLEPEIIERVGLMYGGAKNAIALHARGIEHHIQGVDNCLTMINMVLATGKIGRVGAGYGTITGQGNGQGGREHGQKADQLPGARSIEDPEHRKYIASVWGVDESEIPHSGTSAVEMVDQMAAGEIKGLFGICNNPLVSMPDHERIARGYGSLEFHVQVDFFLSETCLNADVVLPGSVWAEDEGIACNAEARTVKHNKAANPPGEAQVDWRIICEVARRLGHHADKFAFTSAEDIFNELRVASKGGIADYYGITWKRIEDEGGIFWPCPDLDHPGTPRLFEDHVFYTPDKKAHFNPVEWAPPAEEVDTDYPIRLTTGRTVAHFLSGNQTRRIPALANQTPRPWVEVHPSMGFESGDHIKVTTRRGSITLPALVTTTIRPDTVFIPYHWGMAVAANNLTVHALDPVSKIPEFKVCACKIEQGDELDVVSAPPVPPGHVAYADETTSIQDQLPPTASQGRGTAERR